MAVNVAPPRVVDRHVRVTGRAGQPPWSRQPSCVPAAAASRRSTALRARWIGSGVRATTNWALARSSAASISKASCAGSSLASIAPSVWASRTAVSSCPSQSPRKARAGREPARDACPPLPAPRRRSSRPGRCRPQRSAGSRPPAGANARCRCAPVRGLEHLGRRRAGWATVATAAPPWSRNGRTARSCSSRLRRRAGPWIARRCPPPLQVGPPSRIALRLRSPSMRRFRAACGGTRGEFSVVMS